MKVYSAPEHISPPEWPSPFNHEQYGKNCDAYEAAIKQWGLDNGYTGKNTGGIVSFGVADGSARYMLLEGSKSLLIHLDEVDGYSYPDVQYLPKREIIKRIEQRKNLASIFGSRE